MRGSQFRRLIAEGLAAAFLDGEWSPASMADRAAVALGRKPAWLRAAARRAHAAFEVPPRDALAALASTILEDPGLQQAPLTGPGAIRLRQYFQPEPAMRVGRPDWKVRELATAADVASWLGEDLGALAWLADWRGLERLDRDARLRHYVRRWMPKRSGGPRLLEAPKPRLKAIQGRILREVLDRVPPHDAAHGFRAGRSVLTHAGAHAGRGAVLRMDLEDFFASIRGSRVYAVFRTIGYPEGVSRLLTGLCTTRAPLSGMPGARASAALDELTALHRTRQRYSARHLPQGAPTSPALANLCAYGLDLRLVAMARSCGAVYTRYADDLVFSGDAPCDRMSSRLSATIAAVALEEGFRVQARKTRLMRRSLRQEVTGLVVNERPGVPRDQLDRLRATLHNSARFGPESQNREGHRDFRAHLEGAVAWACHVHPTRAAKLRGLLERIVWPAAR